MQCEVSADSWLAEVEIVQGKLGAGMFHLLFSSFFWFLFVFFFFFLSGEPAFSSKGLSWLLLAAPGALDRSVINQSIDHGNPSIDGSDDRSHDESGKR